MVRAINIQLWQSWVLAATVMCTLVMVNLAIADKENHLANGKEVLLKMVPVDPRSLMQGDYMRVRFAIESDIEEAMGEGSLLDVDSSFDGAVMLRLDEHNIGHFERIAEKGVDSNTSENDNMLVVEFRIREGKIKFATSSFFFQEGKAKHYEKANYGLFKVNDKGEPLLRDLVVRDLVVRDLVVRDLV